MLPLVIFPLNVKLLNTWILNIIKGCFSVAHKSKGTNKDTIRRVRHEARSQNGRNQSFHSLAVLCKIAVHRGVGLFTLVLC